MTNQPVWKKIGTVGDINPIDYDGGFIYHDETGVYPAELEYIQSTRDDEPIEWRVYRTVLDRLRCRDGYLYLASVEDNWGKYHEGEKEFYPSVYDEWFNRDLGGVADCVGLGVADLREMLCSEDEQARAFGYLNLAEYFGWENFDSYPLHFTSREELEAR